MLCRVAGHNLLQRVEKTARGVANPDAVVLQQRSKLLEARANRVQPAELFRAQDHAPQRTPDWSSPSESKLGFVLGGPRSVRKQLELTDDTPAMTPGGVSGMSTAELELAGTLSLQLARVSEGSSKLASEALSKQVSVCARVAVESMPECSCAKTCVAVNMWREHDCGGGCIAVGKSRHRNVPVTREGCPECDRKYACP